MLTQRVAAAREQQEQNEAASGDVSATANIYRETVIIVMFVWEM